MSATKSSKLYSPFEFGGLRLRNRLVLAPMTRARCGPERIPGPPVATYYEQRSGAGLLITEATVVSRQGIGWVETPGIYDDAQVEGWRLVTKRVHDVGTPIFLQLWHCGRASHSDFHGGDLPVAPSAVRLVGDGVHTPQGKKPYETPRALEPAEVRAIVADYRRAAERAKEAGFDGVQIHAANGYLIDQFLQSKTNHRTDEYGGSVEKRYRFLNEIVQAVLEVLPADRVAVRLAPNGVFNDMGSPDYRETFTYVIEQLNKFGLGYLHVMDGLAFGFHRLGAPFTLAEIRAIYSGALMGNCGYDKESAEARVDEGAADLIAIGRPYISNPDLARRWEHGWPLNEMADMKVWYTPGDAGYIDFPFYQDE